MDGFSRKKTTAITMKRKLLTMLLVFAVVATYIPFDRAFAADQSGKKQDKQVEKKMEKNAGKQEVWRDQSCGQTAAGENVGR